MPGLTQTNLELRSFIQALRSFCPCTQSESSSNPFPNGKPGAVVFERFSHTTGTLGSAVTKIEPFKTDTSHVVMFSLPPRSKGEIHHGEVARGRTVANSRRLSL